MKGWKNYEMKKIGFIGAYDKTDLLLCIAKILTMMDNKVLIVDSTINQKAKYIVPAISPSAAYITSFEEIDLAVGLYSMQDVINYLGVSSMEDTGYQYILLDIDSPTTLEKFQFQNLDLYFFVTAFDLFSLKKGVEILSGIRTPVTMTKILFSNTMSQAEDEYLNYLSLGMKVQWAENRVYFPLNNEDTIKLLESQKVAKINIKDLSRDYKQSLAYVTEKICGEVGDRVKKVIKQIEKDTSGGVKWQ